MLPFTLAPANAAYTFNATSANNLATATVTGTSADRTLTITPVETDPADGNPDTGTYTDTITLTVSSAGRTDVSTTVAITLNPPAPNLPAATFTGLDTADTTAFDFDNDARDIDFSVSPTSVTVSTPATSTNGLFDVTIAEASGGIAGEWTLSVTAPAADSPTTDGGVGGPYTDTVTITASEDGREDATYELTFTINEPAESPAASG